jgi:hypothetical protein
MPNQKTDAEAALQKLGQRIRAGWSKQHPIADRSLETVRTTLRQDWEQEQQAKRTKKPTPAPPKTRHRKPDKPDMGR